MATSVIRSVHELPIQVSVPSSVSDLNDVCAEVSRAIVGRMKNSDIVTVIGVWQTHWNFAATLCRRDTAYFGYMYTAAMHLITWTYVIANDTVVNATEKW